MNAEKYTVPADVANELVRKATPFPRMSDLACIQMLCGFRPRISASNKVLGQALRERGIEFETFDVMSK